MSVNRREFIIGSSLLMATTSLFLSQAQPTPPEAPARSPVPPGRPKRIVICADGTWNEAEKIDPKTGRPQPTNVLKTARAVLPRGSDGVDQVVYYHYGVGTAGGVDELTGGAFGEGIELNVRQLYRFIVYNYEPGDEIFLFGFSRGAFTVRTLAGFLKKVGLLQKDDEYYTREIFGLYASRTPEDSAEWKNAFRNVKDTRACPQIRFVGVWDTVGSLGAPGMLGQLFNKDKYKYHDVGLNSCIENAFHALALDERRKPFAPTLWARPDGWKGQLEQVWFAGVHSNVGGGYHPDGLANVALHWMVGKAEGLGLQFDSRYLSFYTPVFGSHLNDSMTAIYKLMGPHVRPVGEALADGEAIHESAIERMKAKELAYEPENLRAALAKNPNIPIARTARADRQAAVGSYL